MNQNVAKEEHMRQAIALARESAARGDYALGAVIVKNDEIIATGTTNLKHEHDPTVHGEIVAIRNACKKLNSTYLEGCTLYTTLEPCPMCTAAAIWAKMHGIVYGASSEDAKQRQGKNFSWRQIDIRCREIIARGTPTLTLTEEFLRDACLELFELSK